MEQVANNADPLRTNENLETPCTRADLVALDRLKAPIWVFDLDVGIKWWANRSALVFWGASSNEEMIARNPVRAMSDATRIRLDALRRRFERKEVATERWTFYPTNLPTRVADCTLSGIVIADDKDGPGRLAMLVEANPVAEDELDPSVRRGVEALRYLGEMVSLYALDGELLMRNPTAIEALGDIAEAPKGSDMFASAFAEPEMAQLIRAELEKGPFRGEVEVKTKKGITWHALEARVSLDPVRGEKGVLVNQRDISSEMEAKRALEEHRTELANQAEQLRRLSASPLRVWPGLLALPMIGKIDDSRVQAALRGLEAEITKTRVKIVLLDLTGAEKVDAESAEAIRRMIQMLVLQGVETRVVGVRAELAVTLVHSGIDFGKTAVHATLADALRKTIFRGK